jgi:inosine-uridine nucleoside N-ribohydrolase
LAVYYALHPEFFITKPTYVVVDCESTLCYGRTVVDKKNRYQKDPTVEFGRKLDVDQFWVHMIDAIRLASSNSKIE